MRTLLRLLLTSACAVSLTSSYGYRYRLNPYNGDCRVLLNLPGAGLKGPYPIAMDTRYAYTHHGFAPANYYASGMHYHGGASSGSSSGSNNNYLESSNGGNYAGAGLSANNNYDSSSQNSYGSSSSSSSKHEGSSSGNHGTSAQNFESNSGGSYSSIKQDNDYDTSRYSGNNKNYGNNNDNESGSYGASSSSTGNHGSSSNNYESSSNQYGSSNHNRESQSSSSSNGGGIKDYDRNHGGSYGSSSAEHDRDYDRHGSSNNRDFSSHRESSYNRESSTRESPSNYGQGFAHGNRENSSEDYNRQSGNRFSTSSGNRGNKYEGDVSSETHGQGGESNQRESFHNNYNHKDVDDQDNRQFANEVLSSHNSYRAKHTTPPVILDEKLSLRAQEWANELATGIVPFGHSPAAVEGQYGESLDVFNTPSLTGTDTIDKWYRERRNYNLKSPEVVRGPPNRRNSHFTALIWHGTRKIGIGKASTDDGRSFVVVNYWPPGNIVDVLEENVLPRRTDLASSREQFF